MPSTFYILYKFSTKAKNIQPKNKYTLSTSYSDTHEDIVVFLEKKKWCKFPTSKDNQDTCIALSTDLLLSALDHMLYRQLMRNCTSPQTKRLHICTHRKNVLSSHDLQLNHTLRCLNLSYSGKRIDSFQIY